MAEDCPAGPLQHGTKEQVLLLVHAWLGSMTTDRLAADCHMPCHAMFAWSQADTDL